MKTKCYSVRVESLYSISDKAYKITGFDGSSDIFPKSAVYGEDYEVVKSDAYWIAAWILERKSLQYSSKKVAWFDEDGKRLPSYSIEKHIPTHHNVVANNEIADLKR